MALGRTAEPRDLVENTYVRQPNARLLDASLSLACCNVKMSVGNSKGCSAAAESNTTGAMVRRDCYKWYATPQWYTVYVYASHVAWSSFRAHG